MSYNNIPISEIIIYVQTALSNQPISIVSVGSGNGVLERQISNELKTDIICVDPDPESYEKYPTNMSLAMIPQYNNVVSLIKSKPDLIGNCILLIGWSSPNDTTYDLEAIDALKPSRIVLIYETTGIAGSFSLHKWLSGIPEVPFSEGTASQKIVKDTYKNYTKTCLRLGPVTSDGFAGEKQEALCLLYNINSKQMDVTLTDKLDHTHDHKKDVSDCVIM
jgi:hypothetical protein